MNEHLDKEMRHCNAVAETAEESLILILQIYPTPEKITDKKTNDLAEGERNVCMESYIHEQNLLHTPVLY